jgi:poly(3-hydroxybutyrate) depolymerase
MRRGQEIAMLYSLYEMSHMAVGPMRAMARAQAAMLRSPLNPANDSEWVKSLTAASDVFEAVTRRYRKPEWMLPTTRVNAVAVDVTPVKAWSAPWCDLIHFERDREQLKRARGDRADPAVLIVAPLSGHYATLLRGTVEAFLPEHEVYITDWADARMKPISAGRFDLNDFIDYLMAMIRHIGPGTHVIAVCQPGPAVLAATAIMTEDQDPCVPAGMTFMGSPIDARKSPTVTNKLAEEKPFSWFQQNMIQTVPMNYPGAFREVYPGFIQLASFMGMNLTSHVDAHWEFFSNLTKGADDETDKHRKFYDEYLSVLDLSEEFYLQTIREVFQEHLLPRGLFMHRGRKVRTEIIRNVALMTVEGEHDDISGIGQTQAAHDICGNIPVAMRIDHLQEGVGHYGVFNGRRFRTEIYPRLREFIRTHQTTRAASRRVARAKADVA